MMPLRFSGRFDGRFKKKVTLVVDTVKEMILGKEEGWEVGNVWECMEVSGLARLEQDVTGSRVKDRVSFFQSFKL